MGSVKSMSVSDQIGMNNWRQPLLFHFISFFFSDPLILSYHPIDA